MKTRLDPTKTISKLSLCASRRCSGRAMRPTSCDRVGSAPARRSANPRQAKACRTGLITAPLAPLCEGASGRFRRICLAVRESRARRKSLASCREKRSAPGRSGATIQTVSFRIKLRIALQIVISHERLPGGASFRLLGCRRPRAEKKDHLNISRGHEVRESAQLAAHDRVWWTLRRVVARSCNDLRYPRGFPGHRLTHGKENSPLAGHV